MSDASFSPGPAPAAPPAEGGLPDPVRVLHVEDQEVHRQMVGGFLQEVPETNFQLVTTESLKEARSHLAGEPRPHVILLDLDLPDSKGLDTVRGTLEAAPGVPVIVVSGTDDHDLLARALREGVSEHVLKSELTTDTLHRAIRYALERHEVSHRLERSLHLLRSILDATADGLLVVDEAGHVVTYNDRFQRLWGFPDDLLERGDGDALLDAAAEQLQGPETFRERVDHLRESPSMESFDVLWFQDGRVLERYSQPVELGTGVRGRVWSFRDVTDQARTEAALRESEERFRSLYENATIGLYRTTPAGEILLANPALVRMLGYESLEELAERDLEEPDHYHPAYPRDAWREELHQEVEVRGLETVWVRRDGSPIHVRESSRAVHDEDGDVLYYEGTVEDVTAEQRAKRALERRNELLAALHDVTLGVLERRDVEEVLQALVTRATELLDVPHGWVYLREGETDELEVRVTSEETRDYMGHRIREGEGLSGRVAATGEPITLDDYDAWEDRDPDLPRGKFRAMAGVPLRHEGEVVGVLGLAHEDPGPTFTPQELEMLQRFAELSAIALDNARLFEAAKREIHTRREAEEFLEAVFRASPEPVVVLDADARVRRWNPAAEAVFGWREEEVFGDPLPFIPPDREAEFEAFWGHMMEGDAIAGQEVTRVTRDGTTVELMLSAAPVTGPDGGFDGTVAVLTDIRELKRAERALRRSEERYRTLVETAPFIVYTLDPGDGTFRSLNPAFERILGHDIEDWIGRHFLDIVHPDDRDKAIEEVAQALEGEGPRPVELRIPAADGEVLVGEIIGFPQMEDGEIVRIFGIARDVTERKRQQERVLELKNFNQNLVDHAPVGIAYLTDEGVLTYENHELRAMMGAPGEDEAPRGWFERIQDLPTVQEHPEFVERIEALLEEGEAFEDLEVPYTSLYGRDLHIRVTGVPMVGAGGADEGGLLLVRDVTEEKKLEAEVERQTVKLIQSARMAALGQLVAGVAHEINNPLAAVKGNSELLLESARELAEDPRVKELLAGEPVDGDALARDLASSGEGPFLRENALPMLEMNLKSLDRIRDIVHSLRTFARPASSPESVDLTALLHDTVDIFRAQFRDEVELHLELGDLPPVPCDGGQVNQVVMNLLVNAAQASEGDAVVKLRTRVEDHHVRLEVEDEGPGIPEDVQEEIFDPFFTTKGGESLGLGLAISYNIVQDHGGDLTVASTPGEGTTFTVRLPLEEDP